jgi:molecular chaperone GrpE
MSICRKSPSGKIFEKQQRLKTIIINNMNQPEEKTGQDQSQINDNPEASNMNEDMQPENQPETDENSDKAIEELKEQNNVLNDKYLRLYSEFDNYRRRTAKEKIETVATAGAEIISNLLPVLDDLERAVKSAEKTTDVAALKEGTNLIFSKFLSTLTKKGLEPMDALGKPFDPELHEAITNIPAPNEDMIGKVVDEVEKGYLLNGKVIRFAKVIVGS